MSDTALAAGVGENDRRLAPCRSRDTIFNRNGGEPYLRSQSPSQSRRVTFVTAFHFCRT